MSHIRFLRITLLLCFAALAQAEDVRVSFWLTAGPLTVSEPLFLDSASQNDAARYLMSSDLDWRPAKGEKLPWLPGQTATWEVRQGDSISVLSSQSRTVMFATTYVTSSRWQELPLTIRSGRPLALWLDGKYMDKQAKASDNVYELKKTLTLHRGKHLLVIQAVSPAESKASTWSLQAQAAPDSAFARTISFDTDPIRAPANFADWGEFHELSSPVISPDGKLAAVIHSSRDAKYKKEAWLEVFNTQSSALLLTIRPGKGVSKPFFFPKSNKLGYATSDEDGTTIWSYDLTSPEQQPIIEKIKGFDRGELSPDEQFYYYTADAEPSEAEQKANYRHLDELTDKVTDWTSKRRLFVQALASNLPHEITELGTFALDRFALSREGDKLALVRWVPKLGRPYYDSEIWTYDLKTRRAEQMVSLALTEPPTNLTWLPGGSELAYSAGNHTVSPADTVFPNTNQHPLFLLDTRTKRITNIVGEQRFSVADQSNGSAIFWNPGDQRLYFLATLGGTQKIMKVDPRRANSVSEVTLSRSLTDAFAVAANGTALAATASAPLLPFAALAMDLPSGKETRLLDPNADVIKAFKLAPYEKWEFTNSDGDKIDGWMIFPQDFDPHRKWPAIVYYYGGVSPRDERFTFTYQWWAANGYVVYVLNPVGTIGYGQAFADKHSNDWGTLATRDVIEGTRALIAAKPYVDEKHLGAYGGSYGGFITLDLLTKTDMFAAAVDMYGISNIASYFGGGTWGHLYGDLALPGSYPWTRRDVFVEKSPLYHADKITTPLLILHGEADNNVPPVESDQMFAALKILGRDVEYVRFKDETHNINVKFENLIAHREMMLEWFDKYLKDEPEAWTKRWEEK